MPGLGQVQAQKIGVDTAYESSQSVVFDEVQHEMQIKLRMNGWCFSLGDFLKFFIEFI